ncbi:RpiB/LacA/LacB family sugar-phosphate isomerase [Algoriphagus sp. AGSA1]|uniref:RpiB/LacA/LacB family sugar-phosphate isomerase n=1 Tax=Algoriphagus sp. AGSA1 TaxID=2907213 RepID=UPI001F23CD7D|nr:RpiB/LacA/LacB family sugar-phosphate isomerase [Algoriphagus sp. AGSA1]MCE7054189.1 RpiB/LacA/LacB family sugar-phosphate isomerase [Algoriphagus sp. AGSA1]
MLKIGIAADHAGYSQKELLKKKLEGEQYQLIDYGAYGVDPDDDYPDVVSPLAKALSKGEIQKGIAICGSGVGVSIAANKFNGVRAALITETYSAHQGVEHDDMNMLCLGARVIGSELIFEITKTFLKAQFEDEERFRRRLNKTLALENKHKKL